MTAVAFGFRPSAHGLRVHRLAPKVECRPHSSTISLKPHTLYLRPYTFYYQKTENRRQRPENRGQRPAAKLIFPEFVICILSSVVRLLFSVIRPQKSRITGGVKPGSSSRFKAALITARCFSGLPGSPSGYPWRNGTSRALGGRTFSVTSRSSCTTTVAIPCCSRAAATRLTV